MQVLSTEILPLKHLHRYFPKLCLRASRAREHTIVQSSQIVLGIIIIFFFFKIVPSFRLTLAFLRLS